MNILDNFVLNGMKDKSDETKKAYRYGLIRFEAFLEATNGSLENLTQFDVQSYIDHMQKNLKRQANTINREFSVVAAFAKWSKQQESLIDVRVPKMQNPNSIAPKSLDRLDRNELLRDVQRSKNKRDIAMTYLLYFCGLRAGELVGLDRSDVEISERKGELRVLGKGNKERFVPVDPKARTFITQYLESRNDDCEALFVSEKGDKHRITVRSVERAFKKYGINPHKLRHTFARDLVDAGVDIMAVAGLLGHSDVKTTMRYTNASAADKLKAVSVLGL